MSRAISSTMILRAAPLARDRSGSRDSTVFVMVEFHPNAVSALALEVAEFLIGQVLLRADDVRHSAHGVMDLDRRTTAERTRLSKLAALRALAPPHEEVELAFPLLL